MHFSEIKHLKKELIDKLTQNNYTILTPIQEKVLIHKNKNIIAQAPTGSGKTLCYVLNILNSINFNKTNGLATLIIVPTRELAIQIQKTFDQFDVKSEVAIGGDKNATKEENKNTVKTTKDAKNLNNLSNTKILIGTPGKLHFLIKNNTTLFDKIQFLVLDEVDKLCNNTFLTQLQNILALINKKNRVTHFYTATVTEEVTRLKKQLVVTNQMKESVEVILEQNIPTQLTLESIVVQKPIQKLYLLMKFIQTNNKTIVFFATCAEVDYFYELLNKNNLTNIIKLHGKMKQEERIVVFNQINSNDTYIFLTTDVSARGFDFKNVDLVLHFDICKEHANILHRSGRSGRNGQEGKSILLIMENEKAFINFMKLKYENIVIKEIDLKYEELEVVAQLDATDIDIKMRNKAFVSYIRSYKEHILNYILDYKQLDLSEIKDVFGLENIPKMNDYSVGKKKFKKERK